MIFLLFSVTTTQAQTTAFTYQGRLSNNNARANGSFDMQFSLFDSSVGGNQLGQTITLTNVPVVDGVFTVQLDFGSDVFDNNEAAVLEIGVRNSGDPAFTILSPRVPISPTPYSIRTISASRADVATTALNATQLNGVDASQYALTNDARFSDARQPLAGSTNYIQNSLSRQAAASFNIDGNGTAGGTLSAGLVNSAGGYSIAGTSVLNLASNNLILGTSGQTVQIPGTLLSSNTLFKGAIESLLTRSDGSFANTSVYGANTTITPDGPGGAVNPQPCCQQITLVGTGTSAAESESTVVGYGATAVDNTFVDNCGINIDCVYGGPPVIVGAYANGLGTSLGYKAFTGNKEAVAIGPKSSALGLASFAIGDRAEALPSGPNGNEIVIGDAIRATGNSVIAIGGGGTYSNDSVIALGGSSVLGETNISASFANQQMLIGGTADGNSNFGIKDVYIGNGDVAAYGDWKNSAPFDVSINITGAAGNDQNGKNLRLRSGRGTGAGTPGSFLIATPVTGTAGSNSHSYIDRLQIDGLGNFTLLGGTRLQLQGAGSGTATITTQANAGTPVFTLPANSGTFTVLGNSTTGNGSMIATGAGTYTPGNCVMIDENKNLVDSGVSCTAGSNSMPVNGSVRVNAVNDTTVVTSDAQSQIALQQQQLKQLQQEIESLKQIVCSDHPRESMCKRQ